MEQLTSIDDLLEQMVAQGASDLHISVASPPAIRVRGHIERLEGYEPFDAEGTRQLLYQILSSEQQKQFEIKRQLDFAYAVPGVARFRVNVFFQREALGAAFRVIPHDIKSLEELGLPASLHAFTDKPRGLVLVTGPTGSGKSTTLAAIIDAFPAAQQEQVRVQLAATLQGICTQTLLPTPGGTGRVPALEILFPDDAVRNLIRQGKVEQVYSVMQTGTSKGMQTMEQSLADLVLRKVIALDDALSRSSRAEQLLGLLERAGVDVTSVEGFGPQKAPLVGTLRVAEA